MAETTILKSKSGFQWIDIFNPKKTDIEELAKTYGLHSTSVKDCLDPLHLPKYERFNSYNFVILRAYDEKCSEESDTVHELTRKIAILYSEKFLITIHRKDQSFLAQLRNKWRFEFDARESIPLNALLTDLMNSIFNTFEAPIDEGLNNLEQFEMGMFNAHGVKSIMIEDGYYLKRKGYVFRRVLRLSYDVLVKMASSHEFGNTTHFQDLRETIDGHYFYADELVENINALLNLYISLQQQKTNEASHRTNEVMRVLTIFSVFFMPLNFIASIYGMNFEFMPELKIEAAYPTVLLFMVTIAAGIFIWIKRKGWM